MSPAPHSTGHRIDRDDLLARTNLADVLDALTTGEGDGRRRAWRCPEPDHPDEHPSVKVSADRHGVERWRCWSGGHGGTAIDAVMAAKSMTVGDAIRWINDHYGHLEPTPRRVTSRPRPVGRPAPEVVEYVERSEKLLWSGSGRRVRDWLHARGLDDDVLAANRVGADPGRRYLSRPRGFPAGWPAAVYPALDQHRDVSYFQARLIDPPDGRAKYDNPASRWAANPRLAWGVPASCTASVAGRLVVTEGISDSLVAAQAGLRSAAILGSTYPDRRVAAAIANGADRLGAADIVVCFDGDDAGRTGASRLAELLVDSGASVTDVCPPDGLDLSEWAAIDGGFAAALGAVPAPSSAVERSPSIEM